MKKQLKKLNMNTICIVKKNFKIVLGLAALGRIFDAIKNTLQALVQVLVRFSNLAHVAEQIARQDEKALFLHKTFLGALGLLVGHLGVIKFAVPRLALTLEKPSLT